jgi:chromate reductase, NAD(P)H dehydrogenase (quinone)
MANDPLKVLGLCGSLRRASWNRMALNAAIALAPEGMTIEAYEGLADIPPYNDDARETGYPPNVDDFRKRVAAADAVLFVSPEYNYSIPGLLKNAIDWASRPPAPPFDGKPVAIMGASPGLIGTARMQYHLRQVCVFLNAFPLNRPEVMISQAPAKFTDGKLTDEPTKKFVSELLIALADWTRRVKRPA